MEHPIAKSKVSNSLYLIIILGLLLFTTIAVFIWISVLDSEEVTITPNSVMAIIFSCIPIGGVYLLLVSHEFFFYKDYFILKNKIRGTRKKTYSKIDTYCTYETDAKYGRQTFLEIYIGKKRFKFSKLTGVDVVNLLKHLQATIPNNELFNGFEEFEKRARKQIRLFYKIWGAIWLSILIGILIRDNFKIEFSNIIGFLIIPLGIPLLIELLTKYEKRKKKSNTE